MPSGLDKLPAKTSFSSVDPQWQSIEGNIDYLNDPRTAPRSSPRCALRIGRRRASQAGSPTGCTASTRRRSRPSGGSIGSRTRASPRNSKEPRTSGRTPRRTSSARPSPVCSAPPSPTMAPRPNSTGSPNRSTTGGRTSSPLPAKRSRRSTPTPTSIRTISTRKARSTTAPRGNTTTPSQAQVDKLKANPDKAADFDRMFGPGSSKRFLGQ